MSGHGALAAVFAAGLGAGAWLFYRVGEAHAKAKRAWGDLVGTKNSIRFLWSRFWQEVGRAFRYLLLAGCVLVGAGFLLYEAVTR